MGFIKLSDNDNESKTKASPFEWLKQKTKNIPENSGVYRMFDKNGSVLYVGKAKNLKKRLTSYTREKALSLRIKRMIEQTCDLEIIITENETDALILENDLIKKLNPRYNILLRDDKTFPFILINQEHDFPKITKHRGKQDLKGTYFGPFATVQAVNQTITILQKVFLLRSCSDNAFANRSKPCLLYQIKRCSAPCVDKISREDYQKLVLEAQNFLSGKDNSLQKNLLKKMKEASQKLDFEQASIYRDRIKALNIIQTQNKTPQNLKDVDAIGLSSKKSLICVEVFFYRAGSSCGNYSFFPENASESSDSEILEAFLKQFYTNKQPPSEIILSDSLSEKEDLETYLSMKKGTKVKITTPTKGFKKRIIENVIKNAEMASARKSIEKTLKANIFEKIAKHFNLKTIPKRIEFYDNSHLQGSFPVGAMVAADNSGIIRKDKRKFYIKNPAISANDPAMMKEVLTRRFALNNLTNDPDVIFVDGGKAQLNAALATLSNLQKTNIVVIGAKKNHKHEYEKFILDNNKTVILDSFDSSFHFLQMLGQEVHNFALGVMTKRRKKDSFSSSIEEIKGIGKQRKKALIEHFGSPKLVADASIDELMKVSGINKKFANLIYKHFH